jgi:hypothetical protein
MSCSTSINKRTLAMGGRGALMDAAAAVAADRRKTCGANRPA